MGSSCAATTKLKRSLAEALAKFFPLSGRLCNLPRFSAGSVHIPRSCPRQPRALAVNCNNAGVPFVEASCPTSLADAIPTYSRPDDFPQGLSAAPAISLIPKFSDPLLTVQLTTFSCGGMIVLVSFHHFVVDGSAFFHFMKTWAAMARGESLSCPEPFFDRRHLTRWCVEQSEVAMDHPQVEGVGKIIPHSTGHLLSAAVQSGLKAHQTSSVFEASLTTLANDFLDIWEWIVTIFVLLMSFVVLVCKSAKVPPVTSVTIRVPSSKLKELKRLASTEQELYSSDHIDETSKLYRDISWASTDDMLSAFVWKSMVRAQRIPAKSFAFFQRVCDARQLMKPPLPKGYFGNAAITATKGYIRISSEELLRMPLFVLARVMRGILSEIDNKLCLVYFFSPLAGLTIDPLVPPVIGHGTFISSWCKFDAYAFDFGSGKPEHVCITYSYKPRFLSGGVVFVGRPGQESSSSPPVDDIDVNVIAPQSVIDRLLKDELYLG